MNTLGELNEIKEQIHRRRYLVGFSVVGSLLTILFFAFVNFTTNAHFPWFLFPSYAVLWWPVLTIFVGGRSSGRQSTLLSFKLLSLVGSLVTIAMLFALNYLTWWGYPWFLYPAFAVIWWPIAMLFGARHRKSLSIVGSVTIIAFFVVMNLMNPHYGVWFYYPAFVVVWWPLSVFLGGSHTIKPYSVIGAVILLSFVTLENVLHAPFCPWALFTYYPILMWPTAVLLGRRLGHLRTAVLCSVIGITYYVVLNLLVFRGFPWAIFPAYALLWWPLAIAFAKKERILSFSFIGFVFNALFFIVVNTVTSPGCIWAVYPIFALAWWPLSIYFFGFRRKQLMLPK